MNIFCVGISHHTAGVETRERFAGHSESQRILRDAGCAEALVLSTCNRVEAYGVSSKRISSDDVAKCLIVKSDGEIHQYAPAFYRYEGDKCVEHLFRVVSGLDSMVVGESEILGQAKKAYELARDSGAVGTNLHRLFQRAFRVAKQVRTHTDINRGLVSVASVAVDLAQKIFGELKNCRALVLGAGETSERTAKALASKGVADLSVTNRTIERAHEVARAVGGRAIPFDEWLAQCRKIDILIASTSSGKPILTREILEPILADRVDRPLFIIDIAVPRDVDPGVNEIAGTYLYDIDSLQSVAEQSLALRRQQIAAAEIIIAEHVISFEQTATREIDRACGGVERPPISESSLRTSES